MYKTKIHYAKKQPWEAFCREVKGSKEISRLTKILAKHDTHNIGLPKDMNGTYTSTPEQSMELLMRTHFPNGEAAGPIEEEPDIPWSWITPDDHHPAVPPEMVRRALKSFGAYKAPGPDGIQPMGLQELPEELIIPLANLFSLCIANHYTPKCWRKNKVIFIPKPGQDDYGNPKAFRPITLSNFLLKVLERIIQWHIKETSFRDPLFSLHPRKIMRNSPVSSY